MARGLQRHDDVRTHANRLAERDRLEQREDPLDVGGAVQRLGMTMLGVQMGGGVRGLFLHEFCAVTQDYLGQLRRGGSEQDPAVETLANQSRQIPHVIQMRM